MDQTSVIGRMQLNAGASLDLGSYSLTVGSLAGVAPIGLSARTLTVGTDNTGSSFSGALTGNGSLVKTGSGILASRAQTPILVSLP